MGIWFRCKSRFMVKKVYLYKICCSRLEKSVFPGYPDHIESASTSLKHQAGNMGRKSMRINRYIFLIIFLTFAFLSPPALAQPTTHAFDVNDLVTLNRLSDPVISPSGSQIVFSLRETNLEDNRGFSNLWLTSSSGGELKQLTNNPASDFNPRWSPEGEFIYFLSTRSGTSQVWKISRERRRGRKDNRLSPGPGWCWKYLQTEKFCWYP